MDTRQFRAEFDARVEFTNGGHLEVTGLRVDVASEDVTADEVGTLFVASLGLLMSGAVRVSGLRIVEEAHKGTRAGPSASTGAAARTPRRFVELSHVIHDGMTTYPGLPAPVVTPHLTREDSRATYTGGTEFAIDRITLVGNTGTYLDTPFHRFADGHDLSGLPLGHVVDLPLVVVRTVGGDRAVATGAVAALDVAGCAVLLHTGGDAGFGTPAYADDAPFLTGDAARWLADHGAALVGIDSINIDDVADRTRPAHTALLAADVPVVEHLTGLDQLPPSGARFTAVPPMVQGFGTFPVRAFATV